MCRRFFSDKNPQFSASFILSNRSCYVSSSSQFFSNYSKKSLFFFVSNKLYKKYIETQGQCVSTHNSLCSSENCKLHLVLIGTSFSQILLRLDNYSKLTVFTLCSNTDSIHVMLHQAENYSISLVEQFNTPYDGKDPIRYLVLQKKPLMGKNLRDII